MKKILPLFGLWLMAGIAFAQDVKVKGTVKNSTDSVVSFYKNSFDAVTRAREGKRYKAKLNNKGEFEIILPERGMREWVVEQGDGFGLLYLCSGHHLNLTIDLTQKLGDRVMATGPNAAEINFFSYLEKKKAEKYVTSFYKTVQALAPEDALKMRKERAAFQLALLDDYHQRNKLSPEYYQWLKTHYTYEPYERTLVENLMSNELRGDPKYVPLLTEKGFTDDYAAMNCSEYNDLANYYMHYKMNGSKFPFKTVDFFDFGTKGDLTGLTKQVFLTQQMMFFTSGKDSLYNAMRQKFDREVNNPQLRQRVDEVRNEYLTALAESNRSKENISQSASLNEIFQKYKGKVIYLDFWASWCGPCKAEMPNSNALKNKLKGKDVVFLYFGYQDKKENWLAARKELEIQGEHYLLSPQLIKEASELFQIVGIPHYVIIDKEGNIVNKHAERPGQAYSALMKLLQSK